MSDLLTRAEVVKLARLLDEPPDQLEFLEYVGAAGLRELREQAASALFDHQGATFKRLAAASKLLPNTVLAKLAERVFGPVLVARLASVMAGDRSAQIAEKLSVSFLAEAAPHLDPRRAPGFAHHLQPRIVADVAVELVRRDDYVTLAQFVGPVTDEAIRQVLRRIGEPEPLLGIGAYLESTKEIDRVILMLPEELLRRLVHTALTGTEELRIAGLLLLSRVGNVAAARVGDIVVDASDDVLAGIVDTARAQGAMAELITVVTFTGPAGRARVADLGDGEFLEALEAG